MPILKKYLNGAWVPVTGGTPGVDGAAGADGADGQGVPTGGTTGQVLAKIDGVDYNTQWVDQSGGGITDIVNDTTPQLGGDLDMNDFNINDASGNNYIGFDANLVVDNSNYVTTYATRFGLRANATVGKSEFQFRKVGLNTAGIMFVYDEPNTRWDLTNTDNYDIYFDGLKWPSADGTSGQVLTTDGLGNLSFTTPSGGGATSIDDLTDVDTSTVAPTDGQALVWDGTALKWEPGTISGSASTGDWEFTNNIATNTGSYSYSTTSPRPYLLGIGNGDFTTDDNHRSAFAVAHDLSMDTNNNRQYNMNIATSGEYLTTSPEYNTPSDRCRGLNVNHYLTGQTQETVYMGNNNALATSSYWNPADNNKYINWLGGITTYTRANGGDVGYQSNILCRTASSSGKVTQAVGITFEAQQNNNYDGGASISRYYAIHNGNPGDYRGTGNSGFGTSDNLRSSSTYYFIRNDDQFASNRLGMISNFHEELKSFTISTDTTETLGIWGGGDRTSFTNTVHFDLQANYTLSDLSGLYVGENISGNQGSRTKRAADTVTIVFEQDSTGGRTVTLPSGSNWKYANGNSDVGTTGGSITTVVITAIDPTLSGTLTYMVSVSPEYV